MTKERLIFELKMLPENRDVVIPSERGWMHIREIYLCPDTGRIKIDYLSAIAEKWTDNLK